MENVTDFFRSPEQGGGAASSSRTTSFAALGGPGTPSGPSKANGSEERGSSMDVENAVNEANDEDYQEGDGESELTSLRVRARACFLSPRAKES